MAAIEMSQQKYYASDSEEQPVPAQVAAMPFWAKLRPWALRLLSGPGCLRFTGGIVVCTLQQTG